MLYNKLKKFRKYLLFLCDFIIWNFSFYFAFAINRNCFSLKGYEQEFLKSLLILNICFSVVFVLFRLYDKIWRYADIEDFFYVGLASVIANFIFCACSLSFDIHLGIRTFVLQAILSTFVMFMFRFIYRVDRIIERKNFSNKAKKRMLVVGAGEAALLMLSEFSKSPNNNYIPVCLVDDDNEKVGRRISGLKVVGHTSEIPYICEKYDIEVILFAIAVLPVNEKKRILDICARTNLEVKIVPNIYNLVTSSKSVTDEIRHKIQFVGADGMDFSNCYPQPEFNSRSILWDLNYFKYCFLKATGLEFQEDRLEDDFQKMADVLLRNSSATFMYRDFQSRNVMVRDNEPWLIDFQGGRKGPVYYDVASFLWQAKAKYPEDLRNELLEEYIEALRQYMPVDEAYFRSQLQHFVLFRILQVLGAYGFRGYFEKKPHFIQSVPYAIENLRELLRNDYPEYPYLCSVLRELTELKQFTDDAQKRRLEVKVMSFAYKKGIPNDQTGNGGGFVFDCRAINNPGKYERYNHFTGLDEPVISFLEADGEITDFLEHMRRLQDVPLLRRQWHAST